jgi:hypothetical protein
LLKEENKMVQLITNIGGFFLINANRYTLGKLFNFGDQKLGFSPVVNFLQNNI